MNFSRFLFVSLVATALISLAGCSSGTRANSAREANDATSRDVIDAGGNSGMSPAGATGASTLSGPNNVGGTIGSGSGSTIGTATRTGAAGGGVNGDSR